MNVAYSMHVRPSTSVMGSLRLIVNSPDLSLRPYMHGIHLFFWFIHKLIAGHAVVMNLVLYNSLGNVWKPLLLLDTERSKNGIL